MTDATPAAVALSAGARAAGGKVDHEVLADRLFRRFKAAQKEADRTTEPLLAVPDAIVAKALRIADDARR